jgi:acetyl-CoA acetyltransferase
VRAGAGSLAGPDEKSLAMTARNMARKSAARSAPKRVSNRAWASPQALCAACRRLPPAFEQALQRAGWDIRSIERAEINEAFAAIAIVVARELGLPDEIVNV